jgi:malic enzyme
MSIACVYFGNDRIINEINRMAVQENRIEYASVMWENGDNDIESLPEIVADSSLPGKYSTTVTSILSKHCTEIKNNPADVYKYTAKGNLVGVITNGTAVLGLGNIGPLASKPVMEGKAVLFKIFADIDVFDIEINETDPDKFVEIIKVGVGILSNNPEVKDILPTIKALSEGYTLIAPLIKDFFEQFEKAKTIKENF